MSENSSAGLTRRSMIGLAAAGLGGLALAACGGGTGSGGATTTAAAGTSGGVPAGSGTPAPAKSGGTLRFAPETFTRGTSLDPLTMNANYSVNYALYNTLITIDHQNRKQLMLAESIEPEGGDQSVWTIRLKDGVTFHHGKTLDADDVIYTLGRILDPKNPSPSANLLAGVDLGQIKKMDKRTLRLTLKQPNSQLRDGLAPSGSSILPADYDAKKPMGTGPFRYESFTAQQRFAATRFDDYFAGPAHLDRLEFIGFADPTARSNALLAGQIDGLDGLLPSQLPLFKSRDNLQQLVSQTGGYQVFYMKCDQGSVFADPKVRLAFKLLVDRKQMIDVAWGGYGIPGNDTGVWSQFDPAMDGSLPQRQQDIEQAKSLLKQAGHEGLTITLRTARLSTGMLESAQVLQQNAKAAGVTINLDTVSNTAQYYTDPYYAAPFGSDSDATETMYNLVLYAFTGKGVFNTTGYDNPKVDSLFKEALAAAPDKYQELMHEVSKIISDDGPWIVWGAAKSIDLYDKKFTGANEDAMGRFNGYNWTEISQA